MIKNFFLFLLLIFLLGCNPSEDEIKKFGFENLEEMLRIRGQGFLHKKDYLKSETDKELAKVLGFDNIKEMEINILDGFSNKNEIIVKVPLKSRNNYESIFSTKFKSYYEAISFLEMHLDIYEENKNEDKEKNNHLI